MLTAALALAALLAGLAGAWSPCGLSVVETLSPAAAGGRRPAAAAGAGAFAAGAIAGGVATFGGLALVGSLLGLAGGLPAAVAACALLAAALGDARGRRLVPQVRRQVPESWRRIMPLPVAAGLYGVLLGLGFTTFVLSFATYGIAIACLALGVPAIGVIAGLAFGAGRALPVLVLAPLQEREVGIAVAASMAERPGVLRGLRAAAAVAMGVCALALALGGAPAQAAPLLTASGADPSAADGLLAWEDDQGRGLILRDGRTDLLPGSDPAVAPGLVAWLQDGRVVVADAGSLAPLAEFPAPGADAVALSASHVAWRATGRDGIARLYVQGLAEPAQPPVVPARAAADSEALGPPSLYGSRLLYHLARTTSSRIIEYDARRGARRTLRRARGALLLNPSRLGGRLLYVRSTARRQQLRLGRPRTGRGERVLYSTAPTARRDRGVEPGRHEHQAGYGRRGRPRAPARPRPGVTRTLWTTALAPREVYVTLLRARSGGRPQASILRIPR